MLIWGHERLTKNIGRLPQMLLQDFLLFLFCGYCRAFQLFDFDFHDNIIVVIVVKSLSNAVGNHP